ncbi:MAG: response regulator transcription factor [Verrucomicrobiota bacterium]|jgi:DNA-binding NarL/FixJ family response regulator
MTPDPDSRKNKIIIVDDHPLVREWLSNLINQQPDLMVCGEAGTAPDGLKLIATAKPRVAIVDLSLQPDSGVELIKTIKATCPETAVLVLSMHEELFYVERALRAGAWGYIMKREATRNVLQAIRSVLEGKPYFSAEIAAMMAEKFVEGKLPATASPPDLLSDRELQVFQLLGRCRSTRQIAEEMHISFRTVQSFCTRIKAKLKLSSASELLREAVRWQDRQDKI